MQALRFYGIHDVRVEEIEKPVPGENEVLIEIAYAGICGSDLHIYNKGMFIRHIPETMGHEFVGKILKKGKKVTEFEIGDVVVGNPMVPCKVCPSCKKGIYNTCSQLSFIGEISQGCFARYLVMKPEKLIPVPSGKITMQMALTEPLAVALNICKRAKLKKNDNLAVIGTGPIGLLVILAAKFIYEVREVTAIDLSSYRLEIANKIGADHIQKEFMPDELYGKVVEAAGSEVTIKKAITHTETNGKLMVVSIFEKNFDFDINDLVAKQIELIGCNVYTEKELKEAATYIAENKIDVTPLISHIFPLSEGPRAFEILSSSSKHANKILFDMRVE